MAASASTAVRFLQRIYIYKLLCKALAPEVVVPDAGRGCEFGVGELQPGSLALGQSSELLGFCPAQNKHQVRARRDFKQTQLLMRSQLKLLMLFDRSACLSCRDMISCTT